MENKYTLVLTDIIEKTGIDHDDILFICLPCIDVEVSEKQDEPDDICGNESVGGEEPRSESTGDHDRGPDKAAVPHIF